MRLIGEIIAVFLATVSLLTIPLGLVILASRGLADVGYDENLWIKFVAVSLCWLPPVALLVLLRVWRGRWLP